MEKYKVEERIKICFRDLSNPLKTAVITGWIILGFYIIAFLVGVVIGILEA
jgi:hypothetical protein